MKKSKGITLIALVITCIVLVILTGVTLNLISGGDGILDKSTTAIDEHVNAEMKEELMLAISNLQMEDKFLGRAKLADITAENLKPYLKDYQITIKEDSVGNGKIITLTKKEGTKTFLVDEKFNIREATSNIITYEVMSYADGKVNIKVNIVNELGISTLTLPDGSVLNLNGVTSYSFEYTDKILLNNNYSFKVNSSNEEFEETIKVTLKDLTENQAEISVSELAWTNEVDVEINVKNDVIADLDEVGLKIQYKEEDGVWTDYTGKFTVNKNQKIMARFVDNDGNEGYVFEKDIENIDGDSPTGNITLSKTMVGKGKNSVATVTLTDNESGLDFTKCKYIITNSATNIGTEISSYTGGEIKTSPSDVNISSNIEGKYYLHVLATDKAENNVEIISEAVEVKNIYEISTAQELQDISDMNGTYYIMNDIDMTGFSFATIDGTFAGTIDGQGHTISNLNITTPKKITSGAAYHGIFYSIKGGATIKNLIIENGIIEYSGTGYSAFFAAGASAGNGAIKFEKVGVSGKIIGGGSYSKAGFITELTSPVDFINCYSKVEFEDVSKYDNGGFATQNNDSTTYTNCYYAGTMTSVTGSFGRTNAFSGAGNLDNNDNKHGFGTLNNCYYDKTLFTLKFAPSGTGLTTEEMADSSLYTGWDFKENEKDTDYTWYIDTDTGYPELHFNKAK